MDQYERVNLDESNNLRSLTSSAVKKESVPPYMVGIKTISRLQWDGLVTLLALINCFAAIFELSFECDSMMQIPSIKTLGLFIDLVFLLDVYYNLMTTYLEKQTGDEIISLPKVFVNYVKNTFFLDLGSAVPIFFMNFDCGTLNIVVSIIRLSKLNRVLVVVNRLMYFRLKKSVRVLIKFLEMILWLMIYIHLLACFWYYIVGINQTWQPFSLLYEGLDFYSQDLQVKYSFCIYTIISSISRIEMMPSTQIEYGFLGGAVIVGMLITGIIFGSIIVLLQEIGKDSLKFATEKEKISTTIKNLNLPKDLQMQIIEFFTSSFSILDQEISYQKLIGFLPPSLKKKLNSCLFSKVFVNNKLFQKDQKLVTYLIRQLENKFCQPEEEIIKQFDSGDKIYFVSEGSCVVEVLDQTKEKHKVKTLEQGAFFGEIAVLFKTARTASVISEDFSTLATLPDTKLNLLFSKFPNVKKDLMSAVTKYKDPYRLFVEKILSKLVYLNELNSKPINQLMYSLPIFSCPVNSELFSVDEVCNSCFMILDGKVQISFKVNGLSVASKLRKNSGESMKKKLESANLVVEELGKGSVLCANLLVLQQKFVVSCRCIQQARVMIFTRDYLDKLIQKFPEIKLSVEETITKFTVFDKAAGQSRQLTLPLDYYKCQKYDGVTKKKTMKHRIAFKNAVINKILAIRHTKKSKIPKITSLVDRIQAIYHAESTGRNDIADKIIEGKLQPDAAKVENLLHKKYQISPLIAQFAIKSQETLNLSEAFNENLTDLQEKFKEIKINSQKLIDASEVLVQKYLEVQDIISNK